MSKVQYDLKTNTIIVNGVEWDLDGLKQCCHSDFVYDARNRGVICNKYKIPRELLNEWIESEDWELDKKDFWQRPYSYRIDDAVKGLIRNVSKLTEIQQEVNTIEFHPENLLSRIKIDIEFKEKEEFKSYKTFVIEKYIVKIEEDYDEWTGEKIEYEDEIRYKTFLDENQIIIKHAKMQKPKK
ncbi:hypothetical protein [Sphingobacterium sp. UDSM-2020]|uniref:hypothetical protein n=1 Tax=Sphingobacterium sp. UDSM-2020 TaxID=2795738 RepID=UPI0019372D19|nr:hypothetical protein [Sphingobacterium sp. UDSM-2020]QQD14358.1 hypothetical protein JAZ75_02095 [Sphingobacterium sp. UDSM-2020]